MNSKNEFAPLEEKRAHELKFMINQAARTKNALVLDPIDGITGTVPVSQIQPGQNVNGITRFRTHYRAAA